MARIYRRGGIYWCAYRGYDGERKQESTGVRDPKVAMQIATHREMRHALAREGIIDPGDLLVGEKGQTPIDTVVAKFIETIGSPEVRKDTQRMIDALVTAKAIKTIGELGTASIVSRIENWLEAIAARGVQRRRVGEYLRAVRRLSRFAWRRNYIRSDEPLKAELPATARANGKPAGRRIRHRAFEPVEIAALIDPDLKQHTEFKRFREQVRHWPDRQAFYLFLAWTGLRQEEALRIERSDLVLDDEPAIHIRSEVAKNAMECWLPLAPVVAERLTDLIGLRTGLVFKHITRRREWRQTMLERDCIHAGIDPTLINGRSFRMTHNTWLRLAGVDSETVATLRRDRGSGTALLRRWNYTDEKQLLPCLRASLLLAEAWYQQQVQAASITKTDQARKTG